jgi:hypothetical protein
MSGQTERGERRWLWPWETEAGGTKAGVGQGRGRRSGGRACLGETAFPAERGRVFLGRKEDRRVSAGTIATGGTSVAGI